MKILTLGHSLAVDSCHMLNRIAAIEGIGEHEELTIATLYYSGCRLDQHVRFMNTDSREYSLYISSTDKPEQIPAITKNITMREALKLEYWDMIIMQGGAMEFAHADLLTNGNIQKIQAFVNENKLNPTATFAWHMPWAIPVDQTLRDKYMEVPGVTANWYTQKYEPFNNDRTTLYNAVTKCAKEIIAPDSTFDFVIPTGTAIENALSSYLEEIDLHRDYVHATDYGRVIAAYTWYCMLMGIKKLESIKMEAIPVAFFKSTKAEEDRVLTDMEKAIILEAVNNALAAPFQMTQSQYTTAPVQ